MSEYAVITAESFPTPALALRSNDPVVQRRVRGFAGQQAAAAEAMRQRLATEAPRVHDHGRRIALLHRIYDDLVSWRYELAKQAPGRLGAGLPLDAERFRTPISEAGPNIDRLGTVGRLRDGATWNPATRTFDGGEDTPASVTMRAYGHAAAARFDAERDNQLHPDVLVNQVTLPSGAVVNGNRLVRGAAARRVAEQLTARIAARGGDTSQFEAGGELLYAVTADDTDRAYLFHAALSLLAGAVAVYRDDQLHLWQTARYLLYQAPVMKKGSAAVIGTFLVAVGAYLFGTAPVLEPDADLRCMVLGQHAATEMPTDAQLPR